MKKTLSALTFAMAALPATAEEFYYSWPTDQHPFWASKLCIEDVIREYVALDETNFTNTALSEGESGQISGSKTLEFTHQEVTVTFNDQVGERVQVIAISDDIGVTSPFSMDDNSLGMPYSSRVTHILDAQASMEGQTGYFASLTDPMQGADALGYAAIETIEAITNEMQACSTFSMG